MEYLLLGFFTGLSIILAIGAQNIFVIEQGLKKLPKYWKRKIPRKINIKSDIEQIKQTKKTYCFFKPCSITNMFWAPIAKIRLRPVIKPNNRYSISFY